uniref:Uncharacterized protein n=1 Tax=Lynx canadensis TaxID=61383 RepID=A0A667IDV4_LYNCA
MPHSTPNPLRGAFYPPSSGSNLPLHHNCISLPIWNRFQARKYYLNLQTHQKFLPNSILFVLDLLCPVVPKCSCTGELLGNFYKLQTFRYYSRLP